MASNDLAARLMGDMAPQLLEFLKNKVNTFVKWDLVRFFHENPNTTDTAENIARYAGRDVATIEVEMDELVGAGVLHRQRISDLTVYSLIEDAAMRSLVDQFILACDDRQFGVKAIYHIIRGMRSPSGLARRTRQWCGPRVTPCPMPLESPRGKVTRRRHNMD